MKINFLIFHPNIDGGARVITQHAKFLQEAGHKVRVISLGRQHISLHDHYYAFIRGRLVKPRGIRPQLYHEAGLNLVMFDDQKTLTADHIPDADITIATWWETAEWLAALPDSKGVKAHLIQGHEAALPHGHADRAAAVHKLATKKITISQWLVDVLKREYNIEDCILVENGVDTCLFSAPARTKQHRPTVGFVFSVTNVKNSQLAINACESLRQSCPDLEVITFGSVKPRKNAPLPGWIDFHHSPQQQSIADIYARCDVWLFTSREEGFGLPILEALACGTPVVATRAGASPQIMTDACGALVEMETNAVANAAKHLLDMPEDEWRAMSQAAHNRAQSFSAKESSKAFERALFKATARNGSRP